MRSLLVAALLFGPGRAHAETLVTTMGELLSQATGTYEVHGARSAKGLAAMLAGTLAPASLARGELDVRGAIAPGPHTLDLSYDENGQLHLDGDLATGQLHGMQTWGNTAGATTRTLLMFRLNAGSSSSPGHDMLVLDIPGDLGSLVGRLRGPTPTLRVAVHADSDDPLHDHTLGTAAFAYVPEK